MQLLMVAKKTKNITIHRSYCTDVYCFVIHCCLQAVILHILCMS